MIWVILAGVIAMTMNAHAETGPRMTDADMFKALNLDHPGLEHVKAAVAQQDISAAKKNLAEYYRTREKPVWRSDAATGGRGGRFGAGSAGFQRRLEETLDRQFTVVGVPHRFGAGHEIDWAYNPTGGNSGIEFQREWTWQFNRHGTWSLLGSAYRTTGDETYAKEWAYQASSWMRTCPRPLEGNVNGIGSRWRTIEAGIRMGGSWPAAFYNFRQSPSVSDDILLDMVKTFAEHAYHLMPENRFSPGSNWGAMESNGLFTVGLLFPEFKEAETWRNTAMARLYAELDRQVYSDGMQIELASSYHQVSLRNFIGPLELAHINDYALPADYLAKLERMYDYNLFAAMPDGYLPQFNDSGRSNARSTMREAARFFPERKDFLYLGAEGREGERPARDSYAFPYSGYLVMRSGWDADDLYMMFDVGPFGFGHQHEDKLSFVVQAYGRNHVVDPGNYRYDNSIWRAHMTSAFAHNTVLIDGLGQLRRGAASRWEYVVKKPLPHTWISQPEYDYAAGIYDEGFGPFSWPGSDRRITREDARNIATHERRVLFVKPSAEIPGYWIIADQFTPSDKKAHHYETLFHLNASPDSVAVETGTLRALTQNPAESNIAIWPVPRTGMSGAVLAGQAKPVLRGWISGPETVAPLPVVSYEFEAAGIARAMYILYPVPAGQAIPVVRIEAIPAGAETIAARISFANGQVHHVAIGGKPGRKTFAGFETDGEAAWIAQDATGNAMRAIIAQGNSLKRDGKQIGQMSNR